MGLFKNTNNVELVDGKISLLSPNFFARELVDPQTTFGIEKQGAYLNYDLKNFIGDLNQLIETLGKTSNDYKGFDFNHESVYTLAPDKINVRYTVLLRTPGTMSAGNGPHEGKIQYKFKPFDVLDDTDNPGYGVIVYGQFMDNTILITPWSKTYTTANRAAETLEDLIPEYNWLFQRNGLQQVRYLGRDTDITQTMEQNVLYGCPLKFFIRTLRIKMVKEKKLEEIALTLMK